MIEDIFKDTKFIKALKQYAFKSGVCLCLLDDFVEEVFLMSLENKYKNEKQIFYHAKILCKSNSCFNKKYKYEKSRQNILSIEKLSPYAEDD